MSAVHSADVSVLYLFLLYLPTHPLKFLLEFLKVDIKDGGVLLAQEG